MTTSTTIEQLRAELLTCHTEAAGLQDRLQHVAQSLRTAEQRHHEQTERLAASDADRQRMAAEVGAITAQRRCRSIHACMC